MSRSFSTGAAVSPAARAFSNLAEDGWTPAPTSTTKRFSALFFATMVLISAPLFWAANAVGIAGDVPLAVAASGPGHSGSEEDNEDSGNSGPGGDGDDDSADTAALGTDDTSVRGASTKGTTNDNDTQTNTNNGAKGTNDTSVRGASTNGTTNDNDTRTHTGTRGTSAPGQSDPGTTQNNTQTNTNSRH